MQMDELVKPRQHKGSPAENEKKLVLSTQMKRKKKCAEDANTRVMQTNLQQKQTEIMAPAA